MLSIELESVLVAPSNERGIEYMIRILNLYAFLGSKF